MSTSNVESAAVDTVMSGPETSTTQHGGAPTDAAIVASKAGNSTVPTSTAYHAQATDSLARGTSSSEVPRTPPGPVRTDTTTALAQALAAPVHTPPPTIVATAQRTRRQSTAIGPSTDQSDSNSKDEDQSGPRLDITLLLTNGARHPFILDAKYLGKRNVDVQGNDPFNLSVYKLKELILREWREEWEQKPSSPSYIRLISFGKLLDDKTALKDLKFNRTERNVVHMTIKPQDFMDEDDGKGAKAGFSSGRGGDESRSPGCRCVVM